MQEILYSIIIYPLRLLLEFIFSLCLHIIKGQEGIAVIAVSFCVTLLSLPLYIVAERFQEKERNIQSLLKPEIKRLKKVFSGDEQYLLLRTFYRQNHYHPLMALRSSFSLLIMIPFFMAAYSFLSNLPSLQGKSFLFIRDMASPDAMFCIKVFNASFDVNVLPIAMTVINCIAGAIYAKGHGAKENLQLYITALVFLVILYDSPSGLVLYWTMNNILSLVKNIFYRIRSPLKVLYLCLLVFVLLACTYVLFFHSGAFQRRALLAVCFCLLLFVPFFVRFAKYLVSSPLLPLCSGGKKQYLSRFILFLFSCLCLCLLCGLVIPCSVISSSVVEFFDVDGIRAPHHFVFLTFLQSAGLFLFWPLCIYLMFGKKIQGLFCFLFCSLCLCSCLDTFLFVGDYGTLTRMITFSNSMKGASFFLSFLNLALWLVVACLVLFLVSKKKSNIMTASLFVLCLCFSCMTVAYSASIQKQETALKKDETLLKKETQVSPVFHFSKTKRNVVFLMLDRAESAYFKEALKEDETLESSFSGFTFFPNTVAFAGHTLIAAPPLFAGYEYVPKEINKRDKESLKQKNNEALLMLPRIFTEQADFACIVCDSSWANYSWIPDMSIFQGKKNMTPHLLQGKYTGLWLSKNQGKVKPNVTKNSIERNLLYLSLFRSSPYVLRDAIYDDGRWWNTDSNVGDIQDFLAVYSVLDFLPDLTDFSSQTDTFISFVNETTHKNVYLAPPRYEPSLLGEEKEEQNKDTQDTDVQGGKKYGSSYCTFMAAMKKTALWLDLLKQNGCYDNTRIVIAADHGIGNWDEQVGLEPLPFDRGFFRDHLHPLLLVKDFGKTGNMKEDDTFMTTADVPLLLTSGVIDGAFNPITKKRLEDTQDKKNGVIVTKNKTWSPGQHNPNTFKILRDEYYSVKDDFFEVNSWQKMK